MARRPAGIAEGPPRRGRLQRRLVPGLGEAGLGETPGGESRARPGSASRATAAPLSRPRRGRPWRDARREIRQDPARRAGLSCICTRPRRGRPWRDARRGITARPGSASRATARLLPASPAGLGETPGGKSGKTRLGDSPAACYPASARPAFGRRPAGNTARPGSASRATAAPLYPAWRGRLSGDARREITARPGSASRATAAPCTRPRRARPWRRRTA